MSRESTPAEAAELIARAAVDFEERNPIKAGKYSAKRAYAGEGVQITEIAFDAGVELPEHSAGTPILVQVIQGSVDFSVGEETHLLEQGGIIHVPTGLKHAVYAKAPARITVTFLNH